jgi:hypothetical protein
MELQIIQLEVFELWSFYCKKHGLEAPSLKHGFDLRWKDGDGSESVGAYLTKWGHELTYGHTKKVNGENRYTPFSILHALSEKYSSKLAGLYQEYAKAFKGRAQLLWSRGLKKKYLVQEFSDKEISERPEPIHYIDINTDQAFVISFTDKYASVLDCAEKNPPELTMNYINSLFELSYQKRRDSNYRPLKDDYTHNLKITNFFKQGTYEPSY